MGWYISDFIYAQRLQKTEIFITSSLQNAVKVG